MENLNTKVILEVIESGSFKKAAEKLGYTQAGISYIINAVEKDWGIKLFFREYGGVKLTEEGKLLQPLIQQLHNVEHQLQMKVSEINELEDGVVRIAAFEMIFIHLLPGIVAEFKKAHPKVHFEFITCENNKEVERMVREGDVDLGFFATPTAKDIETIPLFDEPMMVILSPQHPLANGETFPVNVLDKYPYITMKDDEFSEIPAIFQRFDVQPESTFIVTSDYACMAFVSQNLGYGIFSKMAAEKSPVPICALEFSEPVTRTISIGVKSLANSSKMTKAFIQQVQEQVEKSTI